MTTPIDIGRLSDCLDEEFIWRRRELSDVLTMFERSQFEARNAIGRAGYMALYAHWEGFVREAVQLYLHYVSMRGISFGGLQPGMVFAWHPNALSRAAVVGGNPALKVDVASEFDRLRTTRLRAKKPAIDTKSNLSFDVLTQIDCLAGYPGLTDGVDKTILEKKLRDKRNNIAHGRSEVVDFEEFKGLLEDVTGWMQSIKVKLVNAAVLETYRAPAHE